MYVRVKGDNIINLLSKVQKKTACMFVLCFIHTHKNVVRKMIIMQVGQNKNNKSG